MRKVRKPRDLKFPNKSTFAKIGPFKDYPIEIITGYNAQCIQLSTAKGLHKWLGQAVKYLEQERKK